MLFSDLIHSIRRFYPRNNPIISLHQYRRRVWLIALLICVLFWLMVGLILRQLFLC
ncbi:hypothetical protein [Tatumella citrea]|uniref:hypothetical protein n=1 Tax=Tatumella citrea TaxID=53336 RepID=UPI0012FA2B77|nr:hypothetical protein [Tatumella citrea]